MIPPLIANGDKGELIRPTRFLPQLEREHTSADYAYGPSETYSGSSEPDLTKGNYQFGWVGYTEPSGRGYVERKLHNGLWDGVQRQLLSLVGGIKRISLDFDRRGYAIVCYVRPIGGMGIWWRDPVLNIPQLKELDVDIQDALISVENKDDPLNTDIFIWYFKGGQLFMRQYSEGFDIAHATTVTGIAEPEIIQAGINHRYGYQVDYRDKAIQ